MTRIRIASSSFQKYNSYTISNDTGNRYVLQGENYAVSMDDWMIYAVSIDHNTSGLFKSRPFPRLRRSLRYECVCFAGAARKTHTLVTLFGPLAGRIQRKSENEIALTAHYLTLTDLEHPRTLEM